MLLDCVIIGGGPSGLNASLVLGRARKKVILFDENKPRNAVTHESHGFITRDGIKPSEFKRIAREDLMNYPDITMENQRVTDIKKENDAFMVRAEDGRSFRSRKVLLATGLKDELPAIEGIHQFYGKTLFSCPFCDGWELRDRPLVLISEDNRAFHMAKMISNWSNNLAVCTNGNLIFSEEQKEILIRKQIRVFDDEIAALEGESGRLAKIKFRNGNELFRAGGFVTTGLTQAAPFAEVLGCKMNNMGGIETDTLGRTNIEGVYASGDNSILAPSQLIIAASEGSKAAIGIVHDLVNEDF
ncbi:NAD(P)/FAD-dependent oxidoreductase [Cytobacillus oceanisediminis]|uniref:NAD(P)/FAD-dependent oxidoreductase n=1 Tax=Cytobacillus TaxID=2675230 RepID=UPI00203D74A0|nr:NAD(P)/FAD-dependent oxidoreductase [Cytobacillus oceanisediminis]MCM3527740.1 NAD(P)/FAD-dependent oxidoreductase [Cytobacillus oceanisediminis]